MARIPGGVPNWILQTTDPEALIPSPMIDQLLILVSGGPGEKSLMIPGWVNGKVVSKEIRLPAHWAELSEQEKKIGESAWRGSARRFMRLWAVRLPPIRFRSRCF